MTSAGVALVGKGKADSIKTIAWRKNSFEIMPLSSVRRAACAGNQVKILILTKAMHKADIRKENENTLFQKFRPILAAVVGCIFICIY